MIFHNFFFVCGKNGKILELAINGYDSDICHTFPFTIHVAFNFLWFITRKKGRKNVNLVTFQF